ncbi:hypothetical protein H6G00_18680 [Leptolyngbya sp. FACHB-541]|nr:hypothetical protein [Leptolyngbya sp. FACHB-541]
MEKKIESLPLCEARMMLLTLQRAFIRQVVTLSSKNGIADLMYEIRRVMHCHDSTEGTKIRKSYLHSATPKKYLLQLFLLRGLRKNKVPITVEQ